MRHFLISNGFEKTKAGWLFSFLVKLHRLTIEARTKAFFIPHVSGMCLISSASSCVITFLGITANELRLCAVADLKIKLKI